MNRCPNQIDISTSLPELLLSPSLFKMTAEHFVGYAGLQPYQKDDQSTHLKRHSFQPRELEDDEVEIVVSACGM